MRYVVFITLLASCLGCQRLDPRMDAYLAHLNSEKRALEDLIYDQQYEIEVLESQLAESRGKPATEGVKKSKPDSSSTRRRRTFDEVEDAPTAPPEIIEGVPIHPKPEAEPKSEPGDDTPRSPAPPAQLDPPGSTLPAPKTPDSAATRFDARVTQIALNPVLTGGDNFDGEPGDDGFSVVIEPRNAAGQFVPQPNKVSVVLCDPTREGRESFLARWDFDADTVSQHLRKADPQRGIRLQIPWPGAPPVNPRLQVLVRYQTEEGEKFDADREIFVRLAGQYSERWTPRTNGRESALVKRNRPDRDVAPASFNEPTDARPIARPRRESPEDGEPTLLDEYRNVSRPRPSWQPQR